jgi:hypothetical protein
MHHAADVWMGLMPADQLSPADARQSPDDVANGVLAVLTGSALDDVAVKLGMAPIDLADAVETYRHAGHAALAAEAANQRWFQVHVEFPDWGSAEQTAVGHLAPALRTFIDGGVIDAWWFIRKAPCWRLRLQPTHGQLAEVVASAGPVFDDLARRGLISGWHRTVYEPEVPAYGGRLGMEIAHRLFCADSANVISYLSSSSRVIGSRELSVCCVARSSERLARSGSNAATSGTESDACDRRPSRCPPAGSPN